MSGLRRPSNAVPHGPPAYQDVIRERLLQVQQDNDSHREVVDQYRRLARTARELKVRNRALLRAGTGPSGGTDTLITHLESQLSTLRQELSTLYRTQAAAQNRQLQLSDALRDRDEEVRGLREEVRVLREEKGERGRREEEWEGRWRARGRDMETLNDELLSLNLELSTLHNRNAALQADNAQLLQRWMDKMQEDADGLNEDTEREEAARKARQNTLAPKNDDTAGSPVMTASADGAGKGKSNGDQLRPPGQSTTGSTATTPSGGGPGDRSRTTSAASTVTLGPGGSRVGGTAPGVGQTGKRDPSGSKVDERRKMFESAGGGGTAGTGGGTGGSSGVNRIGENESLSRGGCAGYGLVGRDETRNVATDDTGRPGGDIGPCELGLTHPLESGAVSISSRSESDDNEWEVVSEDRDASRSDEVPSTGFPLVVRSEAGEEEEGKEVRKGLGREDADSEADDDDADDADADGEIWDEARLAV